MRYFALLIFVWWLVPAGLGAADDKSRLLYVAAINGNPEIMLQADEGEPKNLSNHPANDIFPTWSPDGARIAFASNRDGGVMNVFVMNADGTEVTKITDANMLNKANCQCPSWSPDGESLVYQQRVGDVSQLFTVELESGRVRQIADNGWDPAWSPGGDKIAFCSLTATGWALNTVEPDGAKLTEIVPGDNKVGFVYPSWSPDGKRIAFTKPTAGRFHIHTCNADGSDLKQLTKTDRMSSHSGWSADGKQVYFYHDLGEPGWRWEVVDVASGKSDPLNDWKPAPYIHGGRLSWWQSGK